MLRAKGMPCSSSGLERRPALTVFTRGSTPSGREESSLVFLCGSCPFSQKKFRGSTATTNTKNMRNKSNDGEFIEFFCRRKRVNIQGRRRKLEHSVMICRTTKAKSKQQTSSTASWFFNCRSKRKPKRVNLLPRHDLKVLEVNSRVVLKSVDRFRRGAGHFGEGAQYFER